jgi:hypothetical protein
MFDRVAAGGQFQRRVWPRTVAGTTPVMSADRTRGPLQ